MAQRHMPFGYKIIDGADDKQLEAAFIQIINQVMENPEMIEKRPAVNAVTESVELRKIKLQISSGLDQNGLWNRRKWHSCCLKGL